MNTDRAGGGFKMALNIESDVLVIGSGGAGLRAAIEAELGGASVTVVSKAPAGMNNSTAVSGGGFRAPIGGLTREEYIRDTIEVGKGLNDRRLVEVMAREGERRLLELRSFGVDVKGREGGIYVEWRGGARGMGLTIPLLKYVRSRGIRVLENVIVTRLLLDGGRIVGAVGYDARGDRPMTFSSRAVILATGGAGAIYRRTDCPVRTTGDGYSLAFEAGAPLRDMEFVQFYPIALAEEGAPIYLIGGYMTEEGRILNRLGEDIPEKHGVKARPLALKSRDLLSRAVMMEILEGRGIGGAVLLDAREPIRRLGEAGFFSTGPYGFFVDVLRAGDRPLKVAPVSHFCMGGVIIDEDGATGVPGLYAAGEVVGGVHGANRHGGNALTEAIVFGARAGEAAASHAGSERPSPEIGRLASSELDRYRSIRGGGRGLTPEAVMGRLKEVMWEKAGIIRGEAGLRDALAEVERMIGMQGGLGASSGREMLEALEASMALRAAEMIIRSALERRESRGAHYRVDYPDEGQGWMKKVVIERGEGGEMKLALQPL